MKTYKFVALLFVFTIILSGCQPTPEKEIVINKGDGNLDKIIESEALSTEQDIFGNSIQKEDIVSENSSAITSIEKWTETYTINGLTCNIDANIILPNTNVFPVYEVAKREFDIQMVKRIINFFTKDAIGVRESSLTKEELEMLLIQAKRGHYMDNDFESWYEPYEGQEEEIALLEEQIKIAEPELFNQIVDDLSFPVDNTYDLSGGKRKYVTATEDAIIISSFKYAVLQLESWVMDGGAYPGEPAGTTLDKRNN